MLRGSSPQEGDPLGIYPGGGLDSRIDPALLPEARAQLGDEVCYICLKFFLGSPYSTLYLVLGSAAADPAGDSDPEVGRDLARPGWE